MVPTDLPALLAALAEGRSFEYRFFWGHRPSKDGRLSDSVFSQWWQSDLEIDGHRYSSAEQWMMAGKARLFGDDESLARILATDDPSACKALGRKVRGFDDERWRSARFDLVTRGNVAKFTPEAMRRYLLATDDQVLVEASPTDRVWGIGLSRNSPEAMNPGTWRGENLLGFALVRAREQLRRL